MSFLAPPSARSNFEFLFNKNRELILKAPYFLYNNKRLVIMHNKISNIINNPLAELKQCIFHSSDRSIIHFVQIL